VSRVHPNSYRALTRSFPIRPKAGWKMLEGWEGGNGNSIYAISSNAKCDHGKC